MLEATCKQLRVEARDAREKASAAMAQQLLLDTAQQWDPASPPPAEVLRPLLQLAGDGAQDLLAAEVVLRSAGVSWANMWLSAGLRITDDALFDAAELCMTRNPCAWRASSWLLQQRQHVSVGPLAVQEQLYSWRAGDILDISDGSTVFKVLLVLVCSPGRLSRIVFHELCQQSVVKHLGSDKVTKLLHAACSFDNSGLDALWGVLGVEQLGVQQVGGLMQAALAGIGESDNPIALCSFMSRVCALPCALQLGPQQVEGAMQGALTRIGKSDTTRALCSFMSKMCVLPGALQLGPQLVEGLLQVALARTESDTTMALCIFIIELCVLPGAQQLGPQQVDGLLRAALATKVDATFARLRMLPGAQQLGPQQVEGLMRLVLAHRTDSATFASLCMLLGPQQLGAQQVEGLMHEVLAKIGEAESSKASGLISKLCTVTGAQQLGAQQVEGLLRAAVLAKADVASLCVLPGAQQLGRLVAEALFAAGIDEPVILCKLAS